MNPVLSVIIASYNHEDYIARTIASIEGQSFQDFEIIIVDDGSTDKSVEVARGVRSRARIHTQENQGVVSARNRGVTLAKGRYICFVDSDDTILPERFERQVGLLDSDDRLGLVFADALIIDSKDDTIGKFSDVYPVIPGDLAEKLVLHYCFTPMITVMVRADVLKRTGPFEKPGPISEYMKWIEIANVSGSRYDPTPLGCWRRHAGCTSSQTNKVKSYARTRASLKKVLRKCPDLQSRVGKKVVRRFSRSYFLSAFWIAVGGDISRARKYYCKALKLNPRSAENWGGLILTLLPAKKAVVGLHRYVRAKKLPW